MKSFFTGKIMEEKWMCGSMSWTTGKDEDWKYSDPDDSFRTFNRYSPALFIRTIERRIFLECDIPMVFKSGYKVNIVVDDEVVVIEDVVYNLDGSVTYATSKVIEKEVVVSREEAISIAADRLAEKLQEGLYYK